MKEQIGPITLELTRGDIVKQADLDVIVNAANAELEIGGGVAGAIHKAAGPGLAKECRPLAPISPGEAVISSGHELPNPYVIHCLGPVYGKDDPADEYLANCYQNALRLAEEKGLRSIGFPAISTGAFGYPIEEAAKVAIETIMEKAPGLSNLKWIRFVIFGKKDLEIHEKVLEEVGKNNSLG